jgi:hypothetical protein
MRRVIPPGWVMGSVMRRVCPRLRLLPMTAATAQYVVIHTYTYIYIHIICTYVECVCVYVCACVVVVLRVACDY